MRFSLNFPRPFLLAFLSAILFVLSFPGWNAPFCAWFALVPWFLLLARTRARGAWGWSWLIGFAFFAGSMWWLVHVTVVGWLILCAYLGIFFAIFGGLVHAGRFPIRNILHLLSLPALWVTLEFLRSRLFSGLGWNLLAYSQTPWTLLIQTADLTGPWGVSFLVVLVNAALAGFIAAQEQDHGPARRFAIVLLLMTAAVGYGSWQLSTVESAPSVRVAVVQGGIPQDQKWEPAHAEAILQRYEHLTRRAALENPDMIVWPESAVPGFLGLEETLSRRLWALAPEVQTPLLVGSPMGEFIGGRFQSTNSAALVTPDGRMEQRYDKLHLVPYGEFVPFEKELPWLRGVLPPIGDFVAGNEATVFALPIGDSPAALRGTPEQLRFSTLICFEDAFPHLARAFVRKGARLLVNMTNDAWFGPTAAAYQHAQASVFRAVESRVPIVRAANTGWSGCIDRAGRVRGSVRDPQGQELFAEGFALCTVSPGPADSLYLRWGDWFALLCLGIGAWFLLASRFTGK